MMFDSAPDGPQLYSAPDGPQLYSAPDGPQLYILAPQFNQKRYPHSPGWQARRSSHYSLHVDK